MEAMKERDITKSILSSFAEVDIQVKKHGIDPRDLAYVKHRRILVDWMCELSDKMRLRGRTAHKAIGILDKFLSLPSELFATTES